MKKAMILTSTLLMLSGCSWCPWFDDGDGGNQAELNPEAKTMIKDLARDVGELNVKTEQTLNTLNKQTNIYARDKEQAKTDREQDKRASRSANKYVAACFAFLVAIILMGICTAPMIDNPKYKAIAMIVAFGLLTGGVSAVMFWPY